MSHPQSADSPRQGRPQRRLLFIASTGGHLSQLVRLAPSMNASANSLWVTFRSPQSESLLADKNVLYVPYIRPRDYLGVVKVFFTILALVRRQHFDGAVSTGAALALGALPAARLGGVPCEYIESVSRLHGPSMTGRLLAASHLTELGTQHEGWAKGRWKKHSSVLATFERYDNCTAKGRPRLFVTLGTIEGYRFDRVVDAILATGLAGDDTVWQLGFSAGRTDLPGQVYDQVLATDFERFAREADLVITHSGVGTILFLLDLGIYPVAVVRRHAHNEHVDDHQEQIASLLRALEIGHAGEVTDVTTEYLLDASRYSIRSTTQPAADTATLAG